MIHLGDITKIVGYDVPITDVVVGGSPCQDLSVAGKRAGLDGERSGLFMEQIRIIKEMRESDRRNGRTDDDVRPRYMVWENVPGALSSNKGEDFRIVLEETAKVADKDAVVPMPDKGKWSNAGAIVGNGWSIAWRILDAQFWGVPQRRRRIALVADFGGQSAPEILFVSNRLSGHNQPSQPKGKETSHDASSGFGADDREGKSTLSFNWQGAAGAGLCVSDKVVQPLGCTRIPGVVEREGFDGYNGTLTGQVSATLGVNCGMTTGRNGVVECYSKSRRAQSATDCETCKESDTANTLNAFDVGEVRATELVCECYSVGINGDKAGTLDSSYYKGCGMRSGVEREVVAVAVDARNGTESETNGALQSNASHSLNGNNVVRVRYIVRRLTPMECERLQGFPDGWTDIGEYTDTNGKKKKASDSARYKALGNSIAIPPWKWVMKRISACYERDATLASLFDGIGGFPYIWEQINGKGSCLWASEKEDFCIAVTKARIS